MHGGAGMCGRGACKAGGMYARGVHGRGECMVGGLHGRGCAWQGSTDAPPGDMMRYGQ